MTPKSIDVLLRCIIVACMFGLVLSRNPIVLVVCIWVALISIVSLQIFLHLHNK
jgi:hypothetical protein